MQAAAIYDPMGHRAIYFIISSDPVKFQGTADFFFKEILSPFPPIFSYNFVINVVCFFTSSMLLLH